MGIILSALAVLLDAALLIRELLLLPVLLRADGQMGRGTSRSWAGVACCPRGRPSDTPEQPARSSPAHSGPGATQPPSRSPHVHDHADDEHWPYLEAVYRARSHSPKRCRGRLGSRRASS